MWEFKEDDYLGVCFDNLVEKNLGLENKETETHRFENVTYEHEDAFIGLHFMNDPLFEIYNLLYRIKYREKPLIEKVEKESLYQMQNSKWLFSYDKVTNQEK